MSETAPTEGQGEGQSRCGFVAVVGAPNVGKSTLVNALVGTKVSIVTHKVQTTRAIIRGIALIGSAQLVFMDTPGIFAPKRRLDRAMVASAMSGIGDADLVLLLIDAERGLDPETEAILPQLAPRAGVCALVINKVDLVAKPDLLALAAAMNERLPFAATFMVSALSGSGIDGVKEWLAERAPRGPWHYPEDEVSDLPQRNLAAEITREKMFLRLHQELPYQSTVETEQWKDMPDGSVRLEQTIYVARDSQRKIVLGKGGATIRAIGEAARRELAELFGVKVHLFLFVKVRENWENDPERYREMGLEYPKE